MEKTDNTKTGSLPQWGIAHFILSHSYVMFLLAVVLGLICDLWIPAQIFISSVFKYIGVGMLGVGPLLIYWAQHTSASSKKSMEQPDSSQSQSKLERDFEKGPYKYTRNPTHVGLGMMTLGLGFVLNSLFSVIFVIIASLVTKLFFLPKEEAVLEERYGDAYREYKKKVNTWI